VPSLDRLVGILGRKQPGRRGKVLYLAWPGLAWPGVREMYPLACSLCLYRRVEMEKSPGGVDEYGGGVRSRVAFNRDMRASAPGFFLLYFLPSSIPLSSLSLANPPLFVCCSLSDLHYFSRTQRHIAFVFYSLSSLSRQAWCW
jgi:hypothetical protein